jgi:methionyl-tRNA formyltransferase
MRVVFAGTPAFSLSSLEALASHPEINLVGVYTQPDRPAGRGRNLVASPVKLRAFELGIKVYQPDNFKSVEAIDTLKSLRPDLIVVTAYGLILPRAVLGIPALGCVNVHASLLPRWRGAAPIQRAIEAGDHVTGITLMMMEPGLDSGPIIASVEVPITPEDTGGSLHDKLSQAGGRLLATSLDAIREQRLTAIPQQPSEHVTYAHKLSKAESPIDWNMSAQAISQKIRAFNPWPIATTQFKGEVFRLFEAIALNSDAKKNLNNGPGDILEVNKSGIIVATGQGRLCIRTLQKPGAKPMDANSFVNGVQLVPGMRFG